MKNKKGILIIILSIFLIIAGCIILFINNKEEKKDKKYNVSPERPFTAIDVRGLIYDAMNESKCEMWKIGESKILAHNINNNKYLVHYERIMDDRTIEEYESIVTIEDKRSIEFPGWHPGERALNEYGFIYYDNQDNQNIN